MRLSLEADTQHKDGLIAGKDSAQDELLELQSQLQKAQLELEIAAKVIEEGNLGLSAGE